MKITTTIRRLETLADYMESVKPEEFDFGYWWHRNHEIKCGFTACALGWATYVPEFKNLGLRMGGYGSIRNPVVVRNRKRIATDLGAAKVIFGIDEKLANILFTPDEPQSPDRHITPQQWSIHARKIIKNLKRKHGIRQRPRSSPRARKSTQAVLRGLPGILHSPTSDHPDVARAISAPSDQSVYSELQPSSG